jgi:hypothetical protein
MKREMLVRLLAIATAVSLLPALPAAADSTTVDTGAGTAGGSVSVNGTILPLTITVTHEISVGYTIDPNKGTVVADPITVTNGTRVPVYVTVESISSASGGDITFTDVGPNDKDWPSLSTADSLKYIALGVKIADTSGWNSGYYADTDWAADDTPVTFGSLAAGATGNLSLTAKSGYAFNSQHTAKANLVLVVSLV